VWEPASVFLAVTFKLETTPTLWSVTVPATATPAITVFGWRRAMHGESARKLLSQMTFSLQTKGIPKILTAR
jgi:hypothetical protein